MLRANTLPHSLKLAGHTLALAWALFWIGAGLWSALRDGDGLMQALQFALVPGGLFLLLVVVVWRYEKVGAWTLLLVGLLIVTHLSRQPEAGVSWLMLAGPPLVGGALLLAYRRVNASPR